MYVRGDEGWERCEVPKEAREDKLRLIWFVSEMFSVLFELGIESYVLTLAPQEYRPEAKLSFQDTEMTLIQQLAAWTQTLPQE